MAHTEKRASAWREFQLGLIGGAVYGTAHTFSGHSLDNLKARLQLDPAYKNLTTRTAAMKLWGERGVYGLFQGIFPPLIGSVFYRMTMLSTYEASHTYFTQNKSSLNSIWHLEIANGYIPRPLVFASAFFSAITRSLVESPFEYMKVMRQTDLKWNFKDVYRGFHIQTLRTTSMLLWIFIPYDVIKTKTNYMSTLPGQWFCTTIICCWCYTISWPLETLKNMSQGGIPYIGSTYSDKIKHLGGFRGLFRGSIVGILGGGFRNGMAMLTMANWQKFATYLGLREEKK